MLPRVFTVETTADDTEDTFTMELQPLKGGGGPAAPLERFEPGQFDMLYAFGVGEVPVSLSGDPSDASRLVHTVRAVGSVTEALRRLAPGDEVGVRGPFGHPWPVERAEGRDLVVVAGGIGMAPLRPVLYHVVRHRHRYGRVALLYGARRPEEILFVPELRVWRSRLDLDVHVTVDRATEDWRGDVGFVTTLVGRPPLDPYNALAMVCGPELMMRYAALELVKRGMSEDDIFVSLERNMKCGIGLCGHCQLGPTFVCKDGPVYPFAQVRQLLQVAEV